MGVRACARYNFVSTCFHLVVPLYTLLKVKYLLKTLFEIARIHEYEYKAYLARTRTISLVPVCSCAALITAESSPK